MSNDHSNLPQPHDGVLLSGLDGTNPLGFLAALGAFRLLSIKKPEVKISWQLFNGTWSPAFFGTGVLLAHLGNELHAEIAKLNKSVWLFDKKLPFAAQRLREEARNATIAASASDRNVADEIASLGIECLQDKVGDFKVTSLCMVRSGDSTGQGLLAYGKRILESTSALQLQYAVTTEWLYEDDQCALRWAPAEDRSYALQWRNPSKVGALSVKGGNCLALIGMRLFSVIPSRQTFQTVAFGSNGNKQLSFTWPVWKYPISLDVVISLLGMSDLQRKQPPKSVCDCRGIAAVYRCDRVMTSTYYANFTPAHRIV